MLSGAVSQIPTAVLGGASVAGVLQSALQAAPAIKPALDAVLVAVLRQAMDNPAMRQGAGAAAQDLVAGLLNGTPFAFLWPLAGPGDSGARWSRS